jgi:hypothetical protein
VEQVLALWRKRLGTHWTDPLLPQRILAIKAEAKEIVKHLKLMGDWAQITPRQIREQWPKGEADYLARRDFIKSQAAILADAAAAAAKAPEAKSAKSSPSKPKPNTDSKSPSSGPKRKTPEETKEEIKAQVSKIQAKMDRLKAKPADADASDDSDSASDDDDAMMGSDDDEYSDESDQDDDDGEPLSKKLGMMDWILGYYKETPTTECLFVEDDQHFVEELRARGIIQVGDVVMLSANDLKDVTAEMSVGARNRFTNATAQVKAHFNKTKRVDAEPPSKRQRVESEPKTEAKTVAPKAKPSAVGGLAEVAKTAFVSKPKPKAVAESKAKKETPEEAAAREKLEKKAKAKKARDRREAEKAAALRKNPQVQAALAQVRNARNITQTSALSSPSASPSPASPSKAVSMDLDDIALGMNSLISV